MSETINITHLIEMGFESSATVKYNTENDRENYIKMKKELFIVFSPCCFPFSFSLFLCH